MNKFTLAFHLSQKDLSILELILKSLKLGHIRKDISSNTFTYSVTTREGIRTLLNKFSYPNYTLKTVKNSDVISFRIILDQLDNDYHFKHSPYLYKIKSCIKLFKNRHLVK